MACINDCNKFGVCAEVTRFWPNYKWLTTVFRKKKIKILKSVKLKQQDVSSEVFVSAIDVKFSFYPGQINAKYGKMLKTGN